MNVRRGVVGLTLSLALIMADPGGSGISGAAIQGGKVLGSTVSGEEPTPYLPGQQETPVVLEVRYRLKGAVRPLLFWIGNDDVGAARLRWRDDQKSRLGYEFLIHSGGHGGSVK